MEVLMKEVKAGYGRAVLKAANEAEEQTAHGIVVPVLGYEGADRFERGILLNHCHAAELGTDLLEPGMVVFYNGPGVRIGDVIVVSLRDILAYEA